MPPSVDADFPLIARAVRLARDDAKKTGKTDGVIECPKCGERRLGYVLRRNPLAHPDAPTVWGACKTANCLAWMM